MRHLFKIVNVCKNFHRLVHLEYSPNTKLDKTIWDRYRQLPTSCKTQVTYVWIDGTNGQLRCRTKTLDFVAESAKDCPKVHIDGSSFDILLNPVAIYNDPINQGTNRIVLCETYTHEGKPTKTNHRHNCSETLNKVCNKDPMFGFEQEFQLMDIDRRCFGWPIMLSEICPSSNDFYCSVGANRVYGRELIESVYRGCLYSGIDISGSNAEVTPSQWEIRTGPTCGIKAADDLCMLRFILTRIAEDYGVVVSFHPKMFPNWNGAGCHVNFSTTEMREENGLKYIEEAIKKLDTKHKEHLKVYDLNEGKDNMKRLTGKYGTSLFDKFTSGVGDKSVSVRIPRKVAEQKKGFLEDRRPACNVDPYRAIDAVVRTVCL